MSWKIKNQLQNILAEEEGYSIFPAGIRTRFALCYPNHYNVGMSNLGLHIIYEQINVRDDTAAERFFMPEKTLEKTYEQTNTPLLSLESQNPLYEFAIIGFAVSFELDYFNILSMLSLGKVELLAANRDENDPIVIAGGPCSTFNPEPLSLFVDAFIIGEGEETINRFLNVYLSSRGKNFSRREILLHLAQIPGVYVPIFYKHHYDSSGKLISITTDGTVPAKVNRQWVRDLDKYPAHTIIKSNHTEFSFYLIETARGCGRHCRFCMAGYCFRRPRNRSLKAIKEMIEAVPPQKKIGLMGPAVSDHPQIDTICQYINEHQHPMSVASFRADSVTQVLVDSLAASGQKTLTLAPEAGSNKLRHIINKGIEDKHLYTSIRMGIKAGIKNFRLYIMVGLPGENDEDIEAIIKMTHNLRKYMDDNKAHGKLTLSINPFVPKPFTPFQWMPMADMKKISNVLKYIKNTLKKDRRIEILTESPKESYLQAILARGDRKIAQILYEAHKAGGSKKFRHIMKEHYLDENFYLYRQRETNELMPWDILDMGVKKEYFLHELAMAKQHKTTIQCFAECKRCGVC
ncbi:TIGR03960 family B12-binding radical SAM protein [Pectinatus sottacetonis]|uniref:TIGR03960 family B12-binding radical SAM protein n=1 Tax=Pectinatus sottacetonis TaxID=1002795 RepID=UPI0018C84EBC|nr:TIGR03960 family B12-binding radical SAM protein [Pectinatus sottacetonis]